jgi:hypothetical protein
LAGGVTTGVTGGVTTGVTAGVNGYSSGTPPADWGWVAPWAVMVALLGLVDLVERVVPTLLVREAIGLTTVLGVLVGFLTGQWAPLVQGGVCALAGWAVFATWAMLAPGRLGFGDARMVCLVAMGAGAASPAGALVALACSAMTAATWGRVRRRADRGSAGMAGDRTSAMGPGEGVALAPGGRVALGLGGRVVSGARRWVVSGVRRWAEPGPGRPVALGPLLALSGIAVAAAGAR